MSNELKIACNTIITKQIMNCNFLKRAAILYENTIVFKFYFIMQINILKLRNECFFLPNKAKSFELIIYMFV